MKYTPEENRRLLEYDKEKYCPLSFAGPELMKCETLNCMLYDDEIYECALGRKSYLDEDKNNA